MDSLAILYKVYVKTNDSGVIVAIDSNVFITDTTNWTEIDSGYTDKYHHAQTQYLENGLTDVDGAFNYKLVDGIVTERTAEEKAAEIPEIEVPVPMYNTTVSNPNLLINPNFKINQRGFVKYSALDGAKFSVDRWKCRGMSIVYPVTNGIKIVAGENDGTNHSFISQHVDNTTHFSGKQVTFSVNVAEMATNNGMISIWADNTVLSSQLFNKCGVVTVTGTVPNTVTSNVYFRIDGARAGAEGGEYSIIEWAKLEISPVATQFVPPDPITEKVKCGIPDDTSVYGYRPIEHKPIIIEADLANTATYPFNDSVTTLSFDTADERLNQNYTVEVESSTDNVGHFIISDKMTNGFKVAYTGSAPSAHIKCYIRGGLY